MNKINFLKLGLVYVAAFSVVFTVLNLPVLIDSIDYIRNKFSDRDEVLETELLMESVHRQEALITPEEPSSNPNSPARLENGVSGTVVTGNYIYIPKLNIKAPILVENSSANLSQVLKDLEKGVVMYPGSAVPGSVGKTVIIGHSSSNIPWNKYSKVFALLSRLEAGDLIYINYVGQQYAYEISDKKTGSVFSLSKTDLAGDLILSSCWPVGTDNGRIVIVSKLVR